MRFGSTDKLFSARPGSYPSSLSAISVFIFNLQKCTIRQYFIKVILNTAPNPAFPKLLNLVRDGYCNDL
jgi:hypothetical protein